MSVCTECTPERQTANECDVKFKACKTYDSMSKNVRSLIHYHDKLNQELKDLSRKRFFQNKYPFLNVLYAPLSIW